MWIVCIFLCDKFGFHPNIVESSSGHLVITNLFFVWKQKQRPPSRIIAILKPIIHCCIRWTSIYTFMQRQTTSTNKQTILQPFNWILVFVDFTILCFLSNFSIKRNSIYLHQQFDNCSDNKISAKNNETNWTKANHKEINQIREEEEEEEAKVEEENEKHSTDASVCVYVDKRTATYPLKKQKEQQQEQKSIRHHQRQSVNNHYKYSRNIRK